MYLQKSNGSIIDIFLNHLFDGYSCTTQWLLGIQPTQKSMIQS